MTTSNLDDLEAVRLVVEAVKGFKAEEQHRIFRWAAEKLNLVLPASSFVPNPPPSGASAASNPAPFNPSGGMSGASDIKTFILQKKPKNDVQFAAAAAYFYRFEAGPSERKESISKEDLQEAARKANRERFANPLNTLNNAHKLGLLDKGSEKATFVLNSVGENLVAMTLPDGAERVKPARKKKLIKATPSKTPAKKGKKA